MLGAARRIPAGNCTKTTRVVRALRITSRRVMKNQRLHRVAEQIQHELAELLRTEVKDPRVGMVTVTHVDVSADMAHAKVYFTALTGREHGTAAEAALTRTGGFLRSQLSRRLKLFPSLG